MNGKTLLLSKTFWVNLLALAGMIMTAAGVVGEPQWTQYEAIALAAVNIGLRLVTGAPIQGVLLLPEDGGK
jgi:hypothetical protein